jgi:hypothetical protein
MARPEGVSANVQTDVLEILAHSPIDEGVVGTTMVWAAAISETRDQ